MKCPACKGINIVYETTPLVSSTVRKRKCLQCGHKFTTVEKVSDIPITKKNKKSCLK
jgi:transcriptional regulator NrdR family protein